MKQRDQSDFNINYREIPKKKTMVEPLVNYRDNQEPEIKTNLFSTIDVKTNPL